MNDWLLAVLIGVACGLVIGIKITRDSSLKLAVKGGLPAKVFHYLASAMLTSVLPYALAGAIMGLHIVVLFGTGLGLIGLTGLCLLAYAWFERAANTATAH